MYNLIVESIRNREFYSQHSSLIRLVVGDFLDELHCVLKTPGFMIGVSQRGDIIYINGGPYGPSPKLTERVKVDGRIDLVQAIVIASQVASAVENMFAALNTEEVSNA